MADSVGTTDGQLLKLLDVRQGADKSMCTVPAGYMAGEAVPASDVIIDTAGGQLTTLTAETKGNAFVDVWRSINSDEPVDSDFSNIRWLFVGEWRMTDAGPGPHMIPPEISGGASRSRWVKFEEPHRGTVIKYHYFQQAS